MKSRFITAGINSVSVKEAKGHIGPDVYFALLDLQQLVQISEDVVYLAADCSVIFEQIENFLREQGKVNAAQIRDLLGTSRKYAIALLEYLDDKGVTRREGDYRMLVEH